MPGGGAGAVLLGGDEGEAGGGGGGVRHLLVGVCGRGRDQSAGEVQTWLPYSLHTGVAVFSLLLSHVPPHVPSSVAAYIATTTHHGK